MYYFSAVIDYIGSFHMLLWSNYFTGFSSLIPKAQKLIFGILPNYL